MKTYKKNNITVKEFDGGKIEHFDKNGNCIYTKFPDGKEWHRKYDKNNNLIYTKYPDGDECHYRFDENYNRIYAKWPDGNENFYINYKKATKAEWKNHYINDNFDYRYIYDIIETLKEHKQKINIQNVKQHLNNIEIDDLEIKYEKVLAYLNIIQGNCII